MAAECFRRLSQELPEYRLVCVTLDGFHPGSEEFGGLEQQTEKLVRMLRDRGTTSFEMVLGLSMGTIFSNHLFCKTCQESGFEDPETFSGRSSEFLPF